MNLLPQIVTYEVAKKKMGGRKEALWCTSIVATADGEKDEVMLISEEIKPLVLAILKLCLSEGINK